MAAHLPAARLFLHDGFNLKALSGLCSAPFSSCPMKHRISRAANGHPGPDQVVPRETPVSTVEDVKDVENEKMCKSILSTNTQRQRRSPTKMRDESAHASRLSTTHPSPAPRKSRAPGGAPAISTNHRRSLAFCGCSKPELTFWCLETRASAAHISIEAPYLGFRSWELGSLAIRGSCTVYPNVWCLSTTSEEGGRAPEDEFARQVLSPNSQESGSEIIDWRPVIPA